MKMYKNIEISFDNCAISLISNKYCFDLFKMAE